MLNVSACRPGNLTNLIIIAPIKNKGINGALQDYRNASKAWIKTRYPQQCTNNQKRTYSEQTNHKTLIGPTKTNQFQSTDEHAQLLWMCEDNIGKLRLVGS